MVSTLRSQLERVLDVQEVVDVASALVAIESHRDAPGRERACAERIAAFFSEWGMEPELVPVMAGRPNVYCTLPGSGGGCALMLNGHTDTVPAYKMEIPPFEPQVRDGLLYGRGTVDMKGQVACMMVAMRLLHDLRVPLKGDLIFTGVINEEDRSEGTEYLVRHGPHADRCVVGEPTGLEIMAGHRGLEWLEFEFTGKAAHGGTPHKGINAISKAARFIRRLEDKLMPELAKRVHPLIGPAAMNLGVIRGGTQPSSVADRCVLQCDRRWVPMETLEQVLGEYQAIIRELETEDPTFKCTMTRMESNMATMDHMPMEIAVDDFLVTDLKDILTDLLGAEPPISAFGGWTDASLISNFAHIPTVVFGPGDLSVAHSRCEYIPVEELRIGTLAYTLLAAAVCNRPLWSPPIQLKNMLDILIKNAMVVDGSGKPAFKADVGVAAGRIAVVAENVAQDAGRTIQAQGLHLAPGFIDPHTHSDLTLLANPRAESKIRQGITTEVVGNCGISPAPLRGAAVEEVSAEARGFGVDVTWTSMAEYLERLRDLGSAVNVVPLVGHSAVRGSVLGYDDVQPTPGQQAEMERLVAEAMEQGARGFSTGLFYPPGFYARTGEVIGLARAAARYGGIYTSHIRSESGLLLEAVAEAIEIGERSDIQVEISHVKVEGYHNFQDLDPLLALLEDARSRGVRLGCDQYPYIACQTWLTSILPYWAQAGGAKAVAQRLKEPEVQARLRQDWEEHRVEWDNRSGVRDWADILVVDGDTRPQVLGKNVAEIAAAEGKDPLETAFDLMVASEGQMMCVMFDQREDIVQTLMRHPLVVVGSDGWALAPYGVLGQRQAHPRSYGTFPRVLGHYVRGEQVLPLEEAVEKMTSIAAERFGLADRGVIRQGAWADLVLFDAQTVSDRATFADPHQYPVGIPYVIVNGVIAIDQGEHTGALAGRVL